jgi:hypothetical protein
MFGNAAGERAIVNGRVRAGPLPDHYSDNSQHTLLDRRLR